MQAPGACQVWQAWSRSVCGGVARLSPAFYDVMVTWELKYSNVKPKEVRVALLVAGCGRPQPRIRLCVGVPEAERTTLIFRCASVEPLRV